MYFITAYGLRKKGSLRGLCIVEGSSRSKEFEELINFLKRLLSKRQHLKMVPEADKDKMNTSVLCLFKLIIYLSYMSTQITTLYWINICILDVYVYFK